MIKNQRLPKGGFLYVYCFVLLYSLVSISELTYKSSMWEIALRQESNPQMTPIQISKKVFGIFLHCKNYEWNRTWAPAGYFPARCYLKKNVASVFPWTILSKKPKDFWRKKKNDNAENHSTFLNNFFYEGKKMSYNFLVLGSIVLRANGSRTNWCKDKFNGQNVDAFFLVLPSVPRGVQF